MSYQIIDETPRLEFDTTQKASVFLRMMAEEIVKISEPITPKKTGDLRRSTKKQVLGLKGKVSWNKNYAIYQEKKQYRNYTTPGTGSKYAERSVQQAVGKTAEVARKANLI